MSLRLATTDPNRLLARSGIVLASDGDLQMLRRAVEQPVRQMILCAVDSPDQGRVVARQVRGSAQAARPVAEICFNASTDSPAGCLQACREATRDWLGGDEPGLLLLRDESPPRREATTAYFWRGMNLLREGWDALPAQIVFLVTPVQYRLLTTEADHLKRWISLKLDLRSPALPEAPAWRGDGFEFLPLLDETETANPVTARELRARLGDQDREAIVRGESEEGRARHYYIPMLAAAVILNDWNGSARYNSFISEHNGALTPADRLRWLRLRGQLEENASDPDAALVTGQERFDLALAASTPAEVLGAAFNMVHLTWGKDSDECERWLERAISAAPASAASQGNYALFLTTVRGDYERAEEHYERAIKTEPASANAAGAFAWFLTTVRRDYDRAEEYYQKAIHADPAHPNNLGNYALFLNNVRRDYDKAEEYYQKAIQADPARANSLGSYALFLERVRRDYDRATEYYDKAIDADPNHANNLGNYAQLLLARGDREDGAGMLRRAEEATAAPPAPALEAELAFYRYAHFHDGPPPPLSRLKQLLITGARSPGWDLSINVERARTDGHPNTALLEALAAVIAEEAPIESLDGFEEWRSA